MDFAELAALMEAMSGKPDALLSRLRDPGVTLTQEERLYLAGRLDGSIKHKTGPKGEGDALRMAQARSVATFERLMRLGVGKTKAVNEAATRLGVSSKTITNHVKEWATREPRASDDLFLMVARHEAESIF